MKTFLKWLNRDRSIAIECSSPMSKQEADWERIWTANYRKSEPQTKLAWQRLQVEINTTPVKADTSWFVGRFSFAGGLLILVLIWFFGGIGFDSGFESRKVVLEDQTVAMVHPNARLSTAQGFNQINRQVYLEGEAYFSVTKGKHPFVINTHMGTVKVLGTKFNVIAKDDRLDVSVTEGVVEVSSPEYGVKQILTKGQFTTVWGNDTDHPLDYSSKNPVFLADETALVELLTQIESRFQVQIQLEDESIANLSISGLFQGEDVETLMTSICLVLDRDLSKDDGIYIIK